MIATVHTVLTWGPKLLVCAVLGAGVVVGAAAPGAAAEPCVPSTLSVSSSLNPFATAYTPGTWVQRPAVLTNTTGAELTDARFDFIIGPNNQKMGSQPRARWNIDGGSWHYFSFYRTNIGMPVWRSDDNGLPVLSAGSKHTVRVSVSFPSGATEGSYSTQFNVGAASCGLTWLGGTSNMNFEYLPSYAPRTPTKSSSRPAATTTKAAATRPSSQASASPSPSASPSASPPPLPSAEPASQTPQAQASAVQASGSTQPVPAAVVLGSIAVLALVSPILLWRRRRRDPAAS